MYLKSLILNSNILLINGENLTRSCKIANIVQQTKIGNIKPEAEPLLLLWIDILNLNPLKFDNTPFANTVRII